MDGWIPGSVGRGGGAWSVWSDAIGCCGGGCCFALLLTQNKFLFQSNFRATLEQFQNNFRAISEQSEGKYPENGDYTTRHDKYQWSLFDWAVQVD